MSEGTRSSVYRGWDPRGQQPAAVKVLKEQVLSDPVSVARFEAEASLLGRLDHPNLLPVIGSGTTDRGQPWFATAWASGGSLADQMVKRGRVPPDEGLRRSLQILNCLEYLHGLGIVHRDVQPENILVGDDVTLLGDLGLALTPDRPRIVSCRSIPSFPPPEEGDLDAIGVVADLFGLGVTLFVLLTGQSAVALRVDPLRQPALAALPAGLGRVIDQATRARPEERYSSARAMARALEEVAGGGM